MSIDQETEYIVPEDLPTRVSIAFQGERGAFGDIGNAGDHQVKAEPVAYRSFADVFHAVAAGETDYGLVPVENSQAGSINEVYDLLRQHDLFVTGEISHPVNHCLLCLPGQQPGDIKRVISHPQALAQCDAYLRELGLEIVASYDTAGSAKMVREENLQGVAAVAGAGAAELYQLDILAHGIQTIKDNYTLARFISAWAFLLLTISTCSSSNRVHRASASGNMSSTLTLQDIAMIRRYAVHWQTWQAIRHSARY